MTKRSNVFHPNPVRRAAAIADAALAALSVIWIVAVIVAGVAVALLVW